MADRIGISRIGSAEFEEDVPGWFLEERKTACLGNARSDHEHDFSGVSGPHEIKRDEGTSSSVLYGAWLGLGVLVPFRYLVSSPQSILDYPDFLEDKRQQQTRVGGTAPSLCQRARC